MQPTTGSLKIEEEEQRTVWLKSEELAQRLRVHRNKIYRMARAGEIPGILVGSEWRFVWDDVLVALMKRSSNGNERS